MSKMIALIGPSGAGKSTIARNIAEERTAAGEDVIIVGRDKLREMMFGYSERTVHEHYKKEDLGIREYKVSEVQDTIIKQALREKKTVIVDNTHLRLKYIKELLKYSTDVEVKLVEASIEDCIERDAARERSVGEEVIKSQFEQLEVLKQNYDFETLKAESVDKIEQDCQLPHAIIFDVDGTLAHMQNRSPYDMSKVSEDMLDHAVYEAYAAAKAAGYKIIICTGREGGEEGLVGTMDWLAENDILYDEFYIRPEGSYEKDYVVKERMWRDIVQSYYVVAMYDDRNQVVDHARKLGFKVFQVAEGNF